VLVTANTPTGLVGMVDGGAASLAGAGDVPPQAASPTIASENSVWQRTKYVDMSVSGKWLPVRAAPLVPRALCRNATRCSSGSSSRIACAVGLAAASPLSGFWPESGRASEIRPEPGHDLHRHAPAVVQVLVRATLRDLGARAPGHRLHHRIGHTLRRCTHAISRRRRT
jgi:hypothetical protein